MPHALSQILPSLESLGIWSYWIIALAAMLEAFFVTGVFVPGTLVVDAGGVLVQHGALDFFDLAWFVAIGSILGGELSYQAGIWARKGMSTRWNPENSPSYQKAERLFRRYGGLALVLGRFSGPLAGLIPFAAAVSGMERRRFSRWNIVSGIPYALVHVALGYFLGDILTRLGPAATRVALFAGAVLLLLAVLWWLVIRIERLLPFVLSILGSVAEAIATNPQVRAWAARHPRLAGFLAHRLDTSRASGLTATLLGAAILYVLTIWAGSALDFLMAEPIVQADTRLANLIHAFRTPLLIRIAAHGTALGDWRVVASLMAATLGWLWIRRRPDLMLALMTAVAGDVVTVALLKRVFDRPRPGLAYFVETSGSFPSGHAAISVAFYGTLFFILWQMRRVGPIIAALLATTLAFAIGLSRIYLIEHYLSDVLNGWLVGTLWLLIGIALAQWWRETRPAGAAAPGPALRGAVLGLAVLLCGFAGWQVATYDKARNVVIAQDADEIVTDIPGLFATGTVPGATESIVGTPLEPVNVLILARDAAAVDRAMSQAGWKPAERPTPAGLARAAWALLTSIEDDRAPVTPYFWRGQPNDLAYEKPATDKTVARRHHIRLWRTNFVTPDGLRLFVGAASFDDGLDWRLLHHIDPNVDAERDLLAADLATAGAVVDSRKVQLSQPRLGTSVAGDPWFSDGRAAFLTLR